MFETKYALVYHGYFFIYLFSSMHVSPKNTKYIVTNTKTENKTVVSVL